MRLIFADEKKIWSGLPRPAMYYFFAMDNDVEITGTDAASMGRDTYVTVRAVYNPTRRFWQSLSVTPYT